MLVVYDFDEDNTLPALRELAPRYPGVVAVKNTLGRGVVNAVRAGFAAATAEVVVVTMADLSDDVAIVPRMVELIRDEGYDIVCASRYMRGGRQIGGPRLKRFLSRTAGVSLYWLAGWPTHDATNAFRAYRRSVLTAIPIESRGGFAYSLEITAKAHAAAGSASPSSPPPGPTARPVSRGSARALAPALPPLVFLCPDPSKTRKTRLLKELSGS